MDIQALISLLDAPADGDIFAYPTLQLRLGLLSTLQPLPGTVEDVCTAVALAFNDIDPDHLIVSQLLRVVVQIRELWPSFPLHSHTSSRAEMLRTFLRGDHRSVTRAAKESDEKVLFEIQSLQGIDLGYNSYDYPVDGEATLSRMNDMQSPHLSLTPLPILPPANTQTSNPAFPPLLSLPKPPQPERAGSYTPGEACMATVGLPR